jgi:hypothetical protein
MDNVENEFQDEELLPPPKSAFVRRLLWLKHFFWIAGMTCKAFFTGDLEAAEENFYWTKFHLSHKGQMVGRARSTRKALIDQYLVALLGLVIILLLLASVVIIILYLYKLFQ